MLGRARIRYRVARGAGHSILQSLRFALFKLRPPAIQRQIDDQNRALFTELKRKRDNGAVHDRDSTPPPT
jgi:hypothetical protein